MIKHRETIGFKKAVLLFEVAVVVLIVSLASLFLFRGYGVFLKAGRKSLDYVKLALLSEEKLYELQVEEIENNFLSPDVETQGTFDSGQTWQVSLGESDYSGLWKVALEVRGEVRQESLDTIAYFSSGEQ